MDEFDNDYEEEIDTFYTYMNQVSYSINTQKAYKYEINKFLNFLDGKPIIEVDKKDIVRYLTNVLPSDKLRNRAVVAIFKFFEALIEFELIEINPAQGIKRFKIEKNRTPVHINEEFMKKGMQLIDGKYDCRNMAMFGLMSFCGLKVGEVHRLNVNDYDRDNRKILVLGNSGKNKVIPLPTNLIQVLDDALKQRIPPYKASEQAFFISQKGRRITIRSIQLIMSATFENMKREFPELNKIKLSAHNLRQSFAMLLFTKDTDIQIVKELMGHSSLETTTMYKQILDIQKEKTMDDIY